ncbi:unnamed protein product, partial [Sphacelaria rigidula]
VALYPCRSHAIGNSVIRYPFDERTKGEAAVRTVDRARCRVGGGDGGSDRRRSGLGAASQDESLGGDSQASVVVPEQNTPLCVSEVLRKALLRSNHALRRAVLGRNNNTTNVVNDDTGRGTSGVCCGQAMGSLSRLSWTTTGLDNAQTREDHRQCGEHDNPDEGG